MLSYGYYYVVLTLCMDWLHTQFSHQQTEMQCMYCIEIHIDSHVCLSEQNHTVNSVTKYKIELKEKYDHRKRRIAREDLFAPPPKKNNLEDDVNRVTN